MRSTCSTARVNSIPINDLEQAIDVAELIEAQAAVRTIYVDDLVKAYIVDLVNTTRDHPDIYLGASPHGSMALFNTTRAWAAMEGRDFVLPDDVKLTGRADTGPSPHRQPIGSHQECHARADRRGCSAPYTGTRRTCQDQLAQSPTCGRLCRLCTVLTKGSAPVHL